MTPPHDGTAVPPLPLATHGRAAGFFAHHGFWAPGVKIFRQLRFGGKAAIILSSFLLPMLALLWLLARLDGDPDPPRAR